MVDTSSLSGVMAASGFSSTSSSGNSSGSAGSSSNSTHSSSYSSSDNDSNRSNNTNTSSVSQPSRRIDTSTLTGVMALSETPTTEETLRSAPTSLDLMTGVDAASTIGAANVGYNVPVQGARVGPIHVDAMQFGRFAPNSISPSAGYSINVFGRPTINEAGKFDFGGHMARQTMVSSQATFEYARTVDPSLSSTRFEVASPDTSSRRVYDIEFTNPDADVNFVEVKAGKSINTGQVATDINMSNNFQRSVDYVFTGNPITGNHGPDTRVVNSLTNAANQTNGLITHQTVDIAPTSGQIDSVVTASRVSRAARGAGKVLGPAAVALDVYTIKSAVDADGGRFGENTQVAVAETAGGWAGAAAGGLGGAKAGGAIGAVVGGPVGAAVGATAGGLIGAVGGAIAGSALGNKISSWF